VIGWSPCCASKSLALLSTAAKSPPEATVQIRQQLCRSDRPLSHAYKQRLGRTWGSFEKGDKQVPLASWLQEWAAAMQVMLTVGTTHYCREELLNKAKAERAARTAAKQQQKAATVIQAAWRSRTARCNLCSNLQEQWQQQYSAAAAQPDTSLAANELSEAVRLVLQAVLPLASSRSKHMLSSGHPLTPVPGCVKGAVAFVLRSMSSSRMQDKYTWPAHSTNPQVHSGRAC